MTLIVSTGKTEGVWDKLWRARLSICVVVVLLVCSGLTAGVSVPARVHRSVILVIASLLLWPAVHSDDGTWLQQLFGTYLCAVPIMSVSEAFVRFRFYERELLVAYSLLFVVLLIAARLWQDDRSDLGGRDIVRCGGAIALGVILVHTVLVRMALGVCYGFGWEHSLPVLGQLVLACCVCWAVWPALRVVWSRRVIGVVLAAHYAITSYIPVSQVR